MLLEDSVKGSYSFRGWEFLSYIFNRYFLPLEHLSCREFLVSRVVKTPRAFSTFLHVRIPAFSRVYDLILLLSEKERERKGKGIFRMNPSFYFYPAMNFGATNEAVGGSASRFSIVDLIPPLRPETAEPSARHRATRTYPFYQPHQLLSSFSSS